MFACPPGHTPYWFRGLTYCVPRGKVDRERGSIEEDSQPLSRHRETLSTYLISFNHNSKRVIYLLLSYNEELKLRRLISCAHTQSHTFKRYSWDVSTGLSTSKIYTLLMSLPYHLLEHLLQGTL